MKETEIEVTLLDIKNLYEYFYTAYRQPGLTYSWSLITCKNVKYLETPYNQISKGVYNEENDPKFYEFRTKYEKIVKQFADRDDQGTIIMENNQPKITELMVEFQKAKTELEKEYKDLLDKLNNKNTINDKFLNQKVKIKIMIPNNDDYPDAVPPFVIDILTR